MSYTLGMAARATGFSKSTIYRAIKAGRVSAGRTDTGDWAIDPAELHRVFPPIEMDEYPSSNGSEIGERASRNARAEGELASAALVTELLRQQLEDIRRDRDHWRGQAQRLVLPAPATTAQPVRMGFVARMFGFA